MVCRIDVFETTRECSQLVLSLHLPLTRNNTNCVIDPLSVCQDCNELATSNVLMFGDSGFLGNRYNQQIHHYAQFQFSVASKKAALVNVELGVGTAVPTVRLESEETFMDKRLQAHLIRINPLAENSVIPAHCKRGNKGEAVELSLDALTVLTLIDEAVEKRSKK
ncbi:unnamed protein product [Didymodactylos carnosus]|uniref:Uncharacterized protein n=1 Tax=Didymodactylos carnosus TaxID=1234261 RepID=A0A816AYG1_9BILA|nr:unnamed protein product [Didymodactylos carnosus]CAF1603833.1 unnamed protein product [Didymodactylos carnosus]CAF3745601.1 unnamed protein product [Didymodactylos carnosus]CAF4482542.1 unnamed protein product [Didymodactylos carnosus]